MKNIILRILLLSFGIALFTMCVPPSDGPDPAVLAEERRLDSLRQVRCPRLLSSAAEYYKNRDWKSTVRVYNEVVELGCDRGDEENVYLFYAIAYEPMGHFDSSEYVLIKGLQKLPDNLPLRKRLAYAYEKQGKIDQMISEWEKIIVLDSTDVETMMNLIDVYKDRENWDDVILIARQVLEVDPANEESISALATGIKKTGGDPMDTYIKQVDDYPDNVSYKINLAQRLIDAGRAAEAVNYIRDGLIIEPDSKPLHRLLGEAYYNDNQLDEASKAYEKLFNLDPRDVQLAITISEINVLDNEYAKAIRWADKAISIETNNGGNAYGQKGNVYYKSFGACRSTAINTNDRIVAALALKYFKMAADNGTRKFYVNQKWLEDNYKDVIFRKQEWFMLTPEQQRKGYVEATSECYDWIEEKLMKDGSW